MDLTRDRGRGSTALRARALLWRTASRAEQEIRAYPRVYAAFYRALGASPAVRRAVGRVKTGVREDVAPTATTAAPPLTPAERRRHEAVATRLGLSPGRGR